MSWGGEKVRVTKRPRARGARFGAAAKTSKSERIVAYATQLLFAKAHRPADGGVDGVVACRDHNVEDRKSSAFVALPPEEELDFAERVGTCLHESEVLGDLEAGDGWSRSNDDTPTRGARRRQEMRAGR